MAIYRSSFNQKPPKKEKQVKKEAKIKEPKEKKPFNFSILFLVVFSLILVSCLFPHFFLSRFLLGVFGLSIYPISALGIFFSSAKLMKKDLITSKKYATYLAVSVLIVWFVIHLILTTKISTESFGKYLTESYNAKTTAGGLIMSLISYPMVKYLTMVGSYIISAIALAIFVGLDIDYVMVEKELHKTPEKSRFAFEDLDIDAIEEKKEAISEEEKSKQIARKKLGLERGESVVLSSSMPNFDIPIEKTTKKAKLDYILTPIDPVIPVDNTESPFAKKVNQARAEQLTSDTTIGNRSKEIIEQKADTTPTYSTQKIEHIEPIGPIEPADDTEDDELFVNEEGISDYETKFETEAEVNEDSEQEAEDTEDVEEYETLETEELDNEQDSEQPEDIEQIHVDLDKAPYEDRMDHYDTSKLGETVESEVVRPTLDLSKFNLPNQVKKPVGVEQVKIEDIKPKEEIPPYVAPPVELLNYLDNPVVVSEEELQDNIDRLEQVLEDFRVPAKVNNVQVGPAVTRYELTMPRGISVNKIATMADDIAMTLASNGAIRVEAPIPGKNSVGIEVPNKQVSPVSLRELIDSDVFRQRGNPTSFVLGKDINGDIIFCNLDKMPHVLVAGSTGSGKSVCLNTMLLSMCYKSGPQDIRLILVDPKTVEFAQYSDLPHLLIPEIITNKDHTINALDWAIREMERRYQLFAKFRVGGIGDYNKLEVVKSKQEEKLPFIVIVIDELADLMLEAKRELEDRIAKLAAKARAAGIHLVLATQRPSVDVITGTIKANLPSRIAFALTNYMDSKTVLDGGGAERLLGRGDMLFKPQGRPEPVRVQGGYVTNEEIAKVVEYIKEHNKPVYDDGAKNSITSANKANQGGFDNSGAKDQEFDPVLKEALKLFIQIKQASSSMIARRYSVGNNRAGRIIDQMEMAGFVGPAEGSKPRQVLITMEEYKAIFGDD